MNPPKTYEQLAAENEQLRIQLDEATETIQAIRTGQIDALVVEGHQGHQLYTLKTADQTYRVFIETMHEGAVTLNEQGLILYSNSTFAVMVDKPLSGVIGTAFTSYIAPLCQPAYEAFFQQSWLAGEKAEMTFRQGNNELICLLSATPLLLDEGKCLSLILTDLTDQKETQALLKSSNEQLARTNVALERSNSALNRSNDNLQQFAYVASHDLQEPLRKIQSFGSILLTTYQTDLGEQGADLLRRMESAAVRMSVLIRDLLAYSRLTSQPDTFHELALNPLVSGVLNVLEILIAETKATIVVAELGTLPGDPTQLAQVFQNLLANALKFIKAGELPTITIGRQTVSRTQLPAGYRPLTSHQKFCLLQVTDNGIGFDAHQGERIFGAFQRLHNRGEYPGTGIGLAIVKKVVDNHHGYVMARSQPGQGATFSVYLPLQ